MEQLGLDLSNHTWGGQRAGAGRKRSRTHDSEHRPRENHVGRNPLHVVLRTCEDVPRLRKPAGFEAINGALKHVSSLTDFRIVHISIQHNHIHLIVEAAHNDALEHGMRAFAISAARRINAAFGRRGKVFAFRYHTTTLDNPTQTRNALVYVLNNWRRHDEDERGLRQREEELDPYSSGSLFRGWTNFSEPPRYTTLKVSPPTTWLLRVGWTLASKPIHTREVPGPLRKRPTTRRSLN
jgi:REP element-mobilizing transposase RayT